MPGALAPERHDNTLDGKGWFPMLSRLLGVFVLQYPVNPSFGFALYMNESYHFNTMWWIMTTIIFIPFVGSCCQVFFWPRFATFSILCLINFFSWAFEAGGVRINIK
jgi:hypothetical protein